MLAPSPFKLPQPMPGASFSNIPLLDLPSDAGFDVGATKRAGVVGRQWPI
jgi:hypothetical protein